MSNKSNFDVSFKNIDDSTFPTDIPNGIKSPFLLCAVGPPGSGKTHNLSVYVHNLVAHHDIRKLYILSPTIHNNTGYFDNLGVNIEICDNLLKAYQFIDKLKDEQLKNKEIWKEIKKVYPDIEKFKEFVEFIKRNEIVKKVSTLRRGGIANPNGYPLTLEEAAKKFIQRSGAPSNTDLMTESQYILQAIDEAGSLETYYNKPPMVLLFCDDIQGSRIMTDSKINPFTSFLIKHRHYYCSVMFGIHTISNSLPLSVRNQITDWMCFKTYSQKLIEKIHDEAVGGMGKVEEFSDFYNNIIDGEDVRFLMVNKKEKPMQGRLNWDKVILPIEEMLEAHKKVRNPSVEKISIPINKKRNLEFNVNVNKRVKV